MTVGFIVGHCVGTGFVSCSDEKKSNEKNDSKNVPLLSLGDLVGFRVNSMGGLVGFRVKFIIAFVGSCVGL